MSEAPADPPLSDDAAMRTGMAAERTWLAWWRTALASIAGALAVGRIAPELLNVAPWPYVVLGGGYAVLAICLLVVGALRQRQLHDAVRSGEPAQLSFALVVAFTAAGAFLALLTMVLVLAQT